MSETKADWNVSIEDIKEPAVDQQNLSAKVDAKSEIKQQPSPPVPLSYEQFVENLARMPVCDHWDSFTAVPIPPPPMFVGSIADPISACMFRHAIPRANAPDLHLYSDHEVREAMGAYMGYLVYAKTHVQRATPYIYKSTMILRELLDGTVRSTDSITSLGDAYDHFRGARFFSDKAWSVYADLQRLFDERINRAREDKTLPLKTFEWIEREYRNTLKFCETDLRNLGLFIRALGDVVRKGFTNHRS